MQTKITLSGPLVLQLVVREERSFSKIEWKYLGWWLISWCIRTRTHQSYKHYSHNSTYLSLSHRNNLNIHLSDWDDYDESKPGLAMFVQELIQIHYHVQRSCQAENLQQFRIDLIIFQIFHSWQSIFRLQIEAEQIWCSTEQHSEPLSQATDRAETRDEPGKLFSTEMSWMLKRVITMSYSCLLRYLVPGPLIRRERY